MSSYTAEIITIGNEILSGRTVNTNASHIARRLTSIGFTVKRITTVMDELEEISAAFKEAISRKPLLIISTGGLGPTYDDKTAEGLAIALNKKLRYDEIALEQIKKRYDRLGLELTEERKKMAYLPEDSIPIQNNQGVAPGIYILYNHIEILALPGVPREMEDILETFIKNYLKTKPDLKYLEKSLIVDKVMESTIAPYIKQLVKKYDLYIKTHPKGYELSEPYLEIQVAGSSNSYEEISRRIDSCINEIKDIVRNLHGIIRTEQ